jgi:hypothetical protein
MSIFRIAGRAILKVVRAKEDLMPGRRKEWAGSPNLQVVEWFQGAKLGSDREVTPFRTVYNEQTRQYEELPLSEFQQLLRQGKIEESVGENPHDGRPQHIYRLI